MQWSNSIIGTFEDGSLKISKIGRRIFQIFEYSKNSKKTNEWCLCQNYFTFRLQERVRIQRAINAERKRAKEVKIDSGLKMGLYPTLSIMGTRQPQSKHYDNWQPSYIITKYFRFRVLLNCRLWRCFKSWAQWDHRNLRMQRMKNEDVITKILKTRTMSK